MELSADEKVRSQQITTVAAKLRAQLMVRPRKRQVRRRNTWSGGSAETGKSPLAKVPWQDRLRQGRTPAEGPLLSMNLKKGEEGSGDPKPGVACSSSSDFGTDRAPASSGAENQNQIARPEKSAVVECSTSEEPRATTDARGVEALVLSKHLRDGMHIVLQNYSVLNAEGQPSVHRPAAKLFRRSFTAELASPSADAEPPTAFRGPPPKPELQCSRRALHEQHLLPSYAFSRAMIEDLSGNGGTKRGLVVGRMLL